MSRLSDDKEILTELVANITRHECWPPSTGGEGGVSDHGLLTGLLDDDHSQYHTDTRGDARYYIKATVDAALAGKSSTSHDHAGVYDPSGSAASAQSAAISASQPVDATLTALAALSATAGLVEQTGTDTFSKRALGVGAPTSIPTRADADARYDASGAAAAAQAVSQPLDADLTALASAGNSAVLAATTASFLTAYETKLAGIAAGATVGAVWGTNVTSQPAIVSQAEAEAGAATTERMWTAQRVNQAIQVLAPGGGSGLTQAQVLARTLGA